MTQPTVCALMLTADRQELTNRAVRSFLSQGYEHKGLLLYDTGRVPYELPLDIRVANMAVWRPPWPKHAVIGALRNDALAITRSDIICHFDSDDISMPTRIAEQVQLLKESGKQAVGFNRMLFWDSRPAQLPARGEDDPFRADCLGEAWLYENTNPSYIIGTSLCYWRAAWATKPFPPCHIGEDRTWIQGLDTLGVSGSMMPGYYRPGVDEPRMIACIHGGNTCKEHIKPNATNPDGSPQWQRVPAWDERLRSILETA